MRLVRLATALAVCAVPAFASAAEPVVPATGVSMGTAQATAQAGDIAVEGGFVREMLPGAGVGGGYMTIRNRGPQPDRLLSISSPTSREVEVHEMKMDGAVMRMRPIENRLEIPAGGTAVLKPGGMHLMFVGVDTPFNRGSEVALTLTFERAGPLALRLPVLAPDAKGPSNDAATDPTVGMDDMAN